MNNIETVVRLRITRLTDVGNIAILVLDITITVDYVTIYFNYNVLY